MKEEQPIVRSSMVPVLGCIALMLFSMSSYKIFDKEFLSKWRSTWCQEYAHDTVTFHGHGDFAFEFDGAQDAIELAQQEIERSHRQRERALQRSMERAEREIARAQIHLNDDVREEVNMERLEEELAAKARSLQALERSWSSNSARLDWKCEMDHENHTDVQIHVLR
jgi:hypothetical protein